MQVNNASLQSKTMFPLARKPVATTAAYAKPTPTASAPVGQIPVDGGAPSKIALAPGTKPPPVDANTILQNWGTSNSLADLNVDGIVDAQDLAMVLNMPGGTGDGDGGVAGADDGWSGVTGGDHNGDGSIDAQDLAIALNNAQGGSGDDGWSGVTGGDHNGDGSIDAQDLAIALNNAQGGSGDDGWSGVTGGDLNGDGAIDAQDLAISLNNAQPAGGGDGWSDLTGGDLNGDGAVDALDLAISLNGPQQKQATASVSGAPIPVGDAATVATNAAGEAPTASARAIDEVVGGVFKMFDADRDGVLVPKDLSETPSLFKRFDADASGMITREELTKGLLEEFDRFAAARSDADPSVFSKRWLDAFAGLRRTPDYMAYQRLGELFSQTGGLNPQAASKILSAKA
jgi:Ca2+-binding EF-hand superfamily protein